jgi:chromosome segregation ATPase
MAENAEIFERLSRIEQTCARIDERTERHDRDHSDHEERIRALERESDKRKGVLAALSFFSSIVGAVLAWVFKAIFGGGN